ncbi:TetR family transcriptional regulator [Saccharothrix saharensis]|uniref:TetR family transcriptional regulator n=1 Tax=Saccharothrix saharensis TaxID=571190 RepID=A0A543JBI8_9PSEU|nr:TetR/AcrR family transcriptional regulator C-terminal domain-containing protein [Saccharothrix saharensis]TQM80199.1 TetR family transcriptional regulator [Saccharothrix saharensis]
MTQDPPWRTPPAKPAVKPRLSRELIVRTGLDVLLAEGLDAVSMRRVAHALGTGPASLYAHVATKDELVELMLDRVLEDVPLPAPDPDRWQHQVKDLLRAQVAAMQAHPGIAEVAWQIMIPIGPNALRHGEALLSLLRAGGLSLTRAAYAADALTLYTKAFAYEGSAWLAVDRTEVADRGSRMGEYLSSLPPDAFANTLAAGPLFTAETAAERFEFGLDLLLGGLAALRA